MIFRRADLLQEGNIVYPWRNDRPQTITKIEVGEWRTLPHGKVDTGEYYEVTLTLNGGHTLVLLNSDVIHTYAAMAGKVEDHER